VFVTEIIDGSVMFDSNYELCYINTIAWTDLLTSEGATSTIKLSDPAQPSRQCKYVVLFRFCVQKMQFIERLKIADDSMTFRNNEFVLGLGFGSGLDFVFRYSVVIAGDAVDVMLMHDGGNSSSLFPYFVESLAIFVLPSLSILMFTRGSGYSGYPEI